MFNLGIISPGGTGRKRTLPALQASSSVKVVALVGRDEAALNAIASDFSVEHVFLSIDECLAAGVCDAVMVCSPPFMHVEQILRIAPSGLPILSEKPLAINSADAREIVAAVEAGGSRLGVAHHMRHHPVFRRVRDLVKDGVVGQPLSASFEWSFKMNHQAASSAWKLDPSQNGPTTFSDAGVHCLDAAVGIFGHGTLAATAVASPQEGGTYEVCDAITKHGNVLVSHRASRMSGPYSNSAVITGDAGEIVVNGFFGEKPACDVQVRRGSEISVLSAEDDNAYRLEVEAFAQWILGHTNDFETSLDDAVHVSDLLEQISQSIAD